MREPIIERAFETLEPSPNTRAALQARVEAAYEARPRSLWLEWLNVLRGRPLVNGAWATAAALVLFVATPLSALPLALLPPRAAQVQARPSSPLKPAPRPLSAPRRTAPLPARR
ncbi:MAG: hypothetical protein K1X89_23150 [Myxococcaceae bacterium]|nr:hypothetical protein [Myxococcaceae bacterium]